MRWLAVVALLLAGCASGSHAATVPGHPAPLSARVELPAHAMTAGTSLAGHVLVDNRTGQAVRVAGCLTLFQVVLTSRGYRPPVAWPSCLQEFTIPVGRSRYRVTIQASYLQCGQGHPRDGLRACLPGGHMPPLPPGLFHARLYQARPVVPTPPAVTIRVTRPSPAG